MVKLATAKGIALPEVAFGNESVYLPLILAVATIVLIPIVVQGAAVLRALQFVLF